MIEYLKDDFLVDGWYYVEKGEFYNTYHRIESLEDAERIMAEIEKEQNR
jgi:hypothetical protein